MNFINDVYPYGWGIIGKYYGYPSCCIKSFQQCKRKFVGSIFMGTGFVPCESCD